MNIDVKVFDNINELAMVFDMQTGEVLYENSRMFAMRTIGEGTEGLDRQLWKERDKDELTICIRNSFFDFRLTRCGEDETLVAIGRLISTDTPLAEEQPANRENGKFVLYDKIMQIKSSAFMHVDGSREAGDASRLDALTGLPNKHYFIELTDQIIQDSSIDDEFAIVYFNIDKFQTFNDAYGFDVGDEFLRSVVKVLLQEFEYYLGARYSDDHFVVLASRSGLVEKIERIHQKIHEYQRDVVMEIKAGIYEFDEGTPVSTACDRAKLACDSIKYNYTEDYRFYDESLREQLLKEKYIIDNIDKAVEHEYLKVYYQPVVRVLSNQVCGMESLVRWDDPQKGFLSPADFIPILEKHRLIAKVDRYVIEKVCSNLKRDKELGHALVPISVNLSRLDFQLFDVCEVVNEITERYGIDRHLIHLEVTESALNDDAGNLYQVIAQLKQNGYEVWLDDFGSEYSTLNTLQNFKFDVLKIDMKFFNTFQSNESARIIILSIVNMAKRLKMGTVAEGVETASQYEFLKELGCDIAQGYYCYRPSPYEALEQQITEVEKLEERSYFDALSRINLLSPEPTEQMEESLEMFFSAPTAIVQLKGSYVKYLFTNSNYMECLKEIGLPSLEIAEQHINGEDSKFNLRILDMAEQCENSNAVQSVDYVYNGNHCNISARKIASVGDTRAYLTTLINLSTLNRERKSSLLDRSLPFIYTIYNRVDLIDLTNDRLDNLYLNALYYKSTFIGKNARQALQDYAAQDIYEEDQQKFLELYNCDTLKERFAKSKKGYIVQVLRTKTRDDKYIMQFYIIIQANMNGAEKYLSCVRSMNMDVVRELIQGNALDEI